MPASYPSSIVTLATHNDGDTIFSADVNNPNAEIVAIETGLLNGIQHNVIPLTDDTYSVGSSSKRWLKAWLQDLDADGTITLATPLTVANGGSGAATLTTHGVLVGEGTSAIAATSVGATGTLLAGNSAADPTFQTASLVGASWVLLKANNGTDTSAGATNVDTVAISGLTANDTIRVVTVVEAVTQNTAQPLIYQSTDGVTFTPIATSPLAAGSLVMGETIIRQRQGTNTNVLGLFQGVTGTSTRVDNFQNNAVTQLWTGSWTLALRHGGVVGGGTFKWEWAVYKVSGQ